MVKKSSLDKTDRAEKTGTGDKTPIESIKESDEPDVELGETKCQLSLNWTRRFTPILEIQPFLACSYFGFHPFKATQCLSCFYC